MKRFFESKGHPRRNDFYRQPQNVNFDSNDMYSLTDSNLSLCSTAQLNPLCYILVLIRDSSYEKLSLPVPRCGFPPKCKISTDVLKHYTIYYTV